LQRPIASELEKNVLDWLSEVDSFDKGNIDKKSEFYHQYKEIFDKWGYQKYLEATNKTTYQTHPQAIYHSRLLPTKKITELLKLQGSKDLELDINNLLEELNIQEESKVLSSEFLSPVEEQEESSTLEVQIQIPHKQS